MKNKRILIIDDHQESCDALRKMIERRGGTAECAGTMEDGRMMIHVAENRGRAFDCIVSDLCLPHFAAEDTIKILQELSQRYAVRALTGAQEPEIIEACHKAKIKLILKGTPADGIIESILYAIAEKHVNAHPDVYEEIATNRQVQREIPAHVAGWFMFILNWPNWVKAFALGSTVFGVCASIVTTGAAIVKTLDAKTIATEAAKQATLEYTKKVDNNAGKLIGHDQDIRNLQNADVQIIARFDAWKEQLDRMEKKIDGLNSSSEKVDAMWKQRLDRKTNRDLTPAETADH